MTIYRSSCHGDQVGVVHQRATALILVVLKSEMIIIVVSFLHREETKLTEILGYQ